MSLANHDHEVILAAVRECKSVAAAARLLGTTRQNLYEYVQKHGEGSGAQARPKGRPRKHSVETVIAAFVEHGSYKKAGDVLGTSGESVRQTIMKHAPDKAKPRHAPHRHGPADHEEA